MEQKKREKGIIFTSIIGVIGNVVLVAIKATIGFIVGSIAIILDALNNLTDSMSSVVTIIGTKLAYKKPNKKHPYGYGRIEYITSTIVGLIIMAAGATALFESIKSIIEHYKNGTLPDYSVIALVIIGLAVTIKIFLGLYFKRSAKKYDSEVLEASGKDALGDAILSTSTLVAALISKFSGFYVEGYLGIVIAFFIFKAGFEVVKDSLSYVIGKRVDDDFKLEIKKEINQIEGVYGVHDLILNNYGNYRYIGSCSIGVKDDLTAKEIQILERKIGYLMYTEYNIIMTTGIYALNDSDEEVARIKNYLNSLVEEDPNVLELHGFYVDEEIKMVYFDLVITFEVKDSEAFSKEISEKMKEKDPEYQFTCIIDRDF